jgi:hypothetical protein
MNKVVISYNTCKMDKSWYDENELYLFW